MTSGVPVADGFASGHRSTPGGRPAPVHGLEADASSRPEHLTEAVQFVRSGLMRTRRSAGTRQPPHLSPREMAIAALVAEGEATKEIAWKLGISEQTVKNHVTHIGQKVGVAGRTKIGVLYAEGMLSDSLEGIQTPAKVAQRQLRRLEAWLIAARAEIDEFLDLIGPLIR